MCTEKHWELCNNSAAYHAATQFALTLEEIARLQGYKPKTIKVKSKQELIRQGINKADAQVIWEEGPKGWTDSIEVSSSSDIDYIIEENSVSFYTR